MEEQELIREAMRAIGRRKSEKKATAARANGAKTQFTQEHREKLKEAQQQRREREKQARLDAGEVFPEKKPTGRPRKHPVKAIDPTAPKRGRGRPKKEETPDAG